MLRETKLSISDISTAVGFSSFATFTRTFGQIMSETPTAHRRHGGDHGAPICAVKALRRPAGSICRQESSFGQVRPGQRR